MQYYSYVARNSDGNIVKGVLEATSLSEFYRSIDDRGLTCIEYDMSEKSRQNEVKTIAKLKSRELILFCKKIGTMIGAGMSITNSLDIMIDSSTNVKYTEIYRNIYEAVRGGMPLSQAMSSQGKSFPTLLCYMVESGEESGNIEGVFLSMSEYYDKQLKMSRKIKSASAYPKLLALVSVFVIIALFGFVLPDLFVMFDGMEIPPLTRFMIGFSDFVTEFYILIIFALVIGYILLMSVFKIHSVKRVVDEVKIKIPGIGKLVNMIYSGRFSSTLSMLYAAGLPLLETLRLSANVIDNLYIQEKLETASEAVGSGTALSQAMEDIAVFDRMLPNMIAIGEETGDLDGLLTTTADYFEGESDTAIESLLSILGPVLLIILAVIVALILISVMVPIYNGYSTISA